MNFLQDDPLVNPTEVQQPVTETHIADRRSYLAEISALCRLDWPNNRTVNIVCHGHSVPSGYFMTPAVHIFESYPHLMHAALAVRFQHAVINVIVTAIGGEHSEAGSKRFVDVLNHRPDVVTIDYGLNDRRIGLNRARKAWISMITQSQAKGIKVLLLTPTPDLTAKLDSPTDPLIQHAEQIRKLAKEYQVGLINSLGAFQQFVKAGGQMLSLMSVPNHPNQKGHQLVTKALLEWFP